MALRALEAPGDDRLGLSLRTSAGPAAASGWANRLDAREDVDVEHEVGGAEVLVDGSPPAPAASAS
jgi:hypothetical protein